MDTPNEQAVSRCVGIYPYVNREEAEFLVAFFAAQHEAVPDGMRRGVVHFLVRLRRENEIPEHRKGMMRSVLVNQPRISLVELMSQCRK